MNVCVTRSANLAGVACSSLACFAIKTSAADKKVVGSANGKKTPVRFMVAI